MYSKVLYFDGEITVFLNSAPQSIYRLAIGLKGFTGRLKRTRSTVSTFRLEGGSLAGPALTAPAPAARFADPTGAPFGLASAESALD